MMEKISRYAIISIGILSSIILLIGFTEYVFPILLPFLIAWLLASVTVSPARSLATSIKAPERVIRLVLSLLLAIIFLLGAGILVWRMTTALWHFLVDISEKNRLYDLLELILSRDIPLLGGIIPDELASRVSEAFGSLLSEGISFIAEGVKALASSLPHIFLFFLVTLISLVYFALDYDKIADFVKSTLPNKVNSMLSTCRKGIFFVLKKYIFSYSLIMLITYCILLIGFLILRVEHPLVLAFFIALLDILPIIGVGTVLVPWSIYELAVGNSSLGVGLILLFLVNAVVRQLSEPKIVGKSLDLHPIVTLILLYVGYGLFGILGMILLPVAAVCLSVILKGDNSAEVA